MLAAVFLPLGAWSATSADPNPPISTQATPADAPAKLSAPAREVVKMALSGVPDDVIKAYIANSSSTFNLNADAIINLHGVGVSTSVTAAMLTHDRMLIDNSNALAANNYASATVMPPATGPMAQPAAEPVAPYQDAGVPPVNYYDTAYSELSPYGSWDYLDGYGWCWQPYATLGYPFFTGGGLIFDTGRWFRHPTRGLVWRPGNRFAGTRFASGAFRSPLGGAGSFHGFASGTVRSSSSFSQPFVSRSGVGVGRVSSGFHGFSSSVSVTHIGGRAGGGSGGHFGGSGHSGGMSHGHR